MPSLPQIDTGAFLEWVQATYDLTSTSKDVVAALGACWAEVSHRSALREKDLQLTIDRMTPHWHNATRYRVLLSLLVESGSNPAIKLEPLREQADRLLSGIPEQ